MRNLSIKNIMDKFTWCETWCQDKNSNQRVEISNIYSSLARQQALAGIRLLMLEAV